VTAYAALWTIAVALQIVLAPLAGLVIASAGVGVAFVLNGASYTGSTLWLRRLPTPSVQHRSQTAARAWTAITEGRRLLIVQVLASLSAGATSGLLVVSAEERLTSERLPGFGVLLGLIGIGAALGPLALRRFIRPGRKSWLFGPYALRGVVDVSLATLTHPAPATVAFGAYGVGTRLCTSPPH
jgi:hypothetical protein